MWISYLAFAMVRVPPPALQAQMLEHRLDLRPARSLLLHPRSRPHSGRRGARERLRELDASRGIGVGVARGSVIFSLETAGQWKKARRAVVGPSSGAQYRGFPLRLTSGKTLGGRPPRLDSAQRGRRLPLDEWVGIFQARIPASIGGVAQLVEQGTFNP